MQIILTLLPLLLQVISAVEGFILGPGKGPDKRNIVSGIAGVVISGLVGKGLVNSDNAVRAQESVGRLIDALVELLNVLGVFKRAKGG